MNSTQLLQKYVSYVIQEIFNRTGFYDKWFVEELHKALSIEQTIDAQKVKSVLGFGNEAIVYKYGDDKAIRFEPCYDLDNCDEIIAKQQSIKERQYAPQIFDLGIVNYYSDDEIQPLCVYTIMQLLYRLPNEDKAIIDDVQTGKISLEDVQNQPLREFIEWYLEEGQDPSPDNVMIDAFGRYVAIDA